MAAEANVLINIEGKPYMLSKHLKKSNLIEIITKLQEDLTKIKQFTKTQIDYKAALQKLKAENRELQALVLAKENGPKNKENCEETNSQAEITNSLRENYEKKARNTMQLYEEKIDLLKKQIIEIEKDRETYAEAIENKQIAISNLKRETERLKKESEETEHRHQDALRDLKQRQEMEKQRTERDKQKLQKEMEVLRRTYIDLDKIRKYLEKNNASLKSSITEAARINDERIKKLTKDFDDREARHLEEIKTMRRDVEVVVQEAEVKIEKIEEKMHKNVEEHQTKTNEVLGENELLRTKIKTFEQNEESLKADVFMNQELVEKTKKFYEETIRTLNEKIHTEHETMDNSTQELKTQYENRIQELEGQKDSLESDANTKTKKLALLQTENEFMSDKIIELRLMGEENNKKYVENYNILKDKVGTIKTNYETEKFDLKTEINNRDKVIDDLNLQNQKLEKQIKNLLYTNDLLKQENEKDLDKIWLKIQNQKDCYTEELQKLKETHNKKVKLIDNDLQQSKIDYEVLDKHYNELLQQKQQLDKNYQEVNERLAKIEAENETKVTEMKSEFLKNGKYLKQDFEKQGRDLLAQNKVIQGLEMDISKLKTANGELQEKLELSEMKAKEECNRLSETIEENSKFYKTDLQNMKQLLVYKEELIKKLEDNNQEQQDSFNFKLAEKQLDLQNMETSHEQETAEITKNYEVQKQKYDILIYEFYKELKEQQGQTDELARLKAILETENIFLKNRNSEIIVNISKQKDKFQDDLEFMKLLECLVKAA